MPNRILKESICTSATIDQLTLEEENFFYRLIVQCDDYGRMDARPAILRARCFPLRLSRINDQGIARWLDRLQEVGLLQRYTVKGQSYLQLSTWATHQQIRAKRPKYPAMSEGEEWTDDICKQMISDDSICPRNPIQSNPITSQPLEATPPTPSKPEKRKLATGLFAPETETFQLASLLREKMLQHNPKAKVPGLATGPFQAWCYHVDLLLRENGRSPDEVRQVILWCQADEFWHMNILSTRKLREEFDRLFLGMQRAARAPKNGRQSTPPAMTPEESANAYPEYFR